MLHLSLCHTIIVEYEDGNRKYNASSPDELALVMGAKFCGFEYLGMEENIMSVEYKNKKFKYKLL